MDEGRCVNCGFLAIATRYTPEYNWRYSEVSEDRRTKGFEPSVVPNVRLHCFRGVADLPKEMEALSAVAGHERHLPVINKYRMCPEWYPWTPGFDPSWHYEELRMQRLEDRRRESEQRAEQERREWEHGVERERRRFDLVLVAIVVIFAIAEVVATIWG